MLRRRDLALESADLGAGLVAERSRGRVGRVLDEQRGWPPGTGPADHAGVPQKEADGTGTRLTVRVSNELRAAIERSAASARPV
ncbi:MAG TPA: hypothetical protein VHV78_11215 [Gemmatimonadaceae bacterium]|nr:hypothetical protein [Gemmatimonadaceae bacterium]